MKILVTGAAGFIGYHVAERLLADGHEVLGIDNLNSYYDVNLKNARLERLEHHRLFSFSRMDISDRNAINELFQSTMFDSVIHLAAQAGVRYSIENPYAYADSNLVGFLNVLEGCRHQQIGHLLYASSSSVYGANTKVPFSISDNVDHPVSLYAATKKANELMAHTYSHLYGLPTTGLRFFTVYGPWGRPDMAYFSFTKAIIAGEPIDLFHHGRAQRDFTYIDDIVEGIVNLLDVVPKRDYSQLEPDGIGGSNAPYQIYNLGNSQPVELSRFVEVLETCLGRKAKKRYVAAQPGDVPSTFADTSELLATIGFEPKIALGTGLARFVDWFLSYYEVQAQTKAEVETKLVPRINEVTYTNSKSGSSQCN